MNDAGNPIEIDISSNVLSVFDEGLGNYRYLLGHILGEFYEIPDEIELYASVYFKRNTEMEWENVTFELNAGEKIFKAKLPAGLLVVSFFMRIYGWVNDKFEMMPFRISRKLLPVGKYGGEPVKLLQEILEPGPPDFVLAFDPFLIKIPQVGDIQPSTVTVVWATTHPATSKIIYGESSDNLDRVITDNEFVEFHSIPIDGLDIEKKYYLKIYSTSESTGKEISTDIIEFTTGKEITVVSDNISNALNLILKDYDNLLVDAVFNVAPEILSTLNPNGVGDTSNSAEFSTHDIEILEAANIIETDFDYEVN